MINEYVIKDDFNSKIFGVEFGNVVAEKFNGLLVKDIEKILKSNNNFDFLSIKIDSNNQELFHRIQMAGFYVVDTLVTYEIDSEKTTLPPRKYNSIMTYEKPKKNSIDDLANVAKSVFKIDRFHSDPNIEDDKCDKYYEHWVKNSFDGFADGACVVERDGKSVAFSTYNLNSINNETSTIVLSAVNSDYFGFGIYGDMIHSCTKKLLEHSRVVRVGTQVNNIPVQRTWVKYGYRLVSTMYVLHYKKG
jgi:hypothetical protein